MYEPTCQCKNSQIVAAFTKREQIWKQIASMAGLEPRIAHNQFKKMIQVAACHMNISCRKFQEKDCLVKKKKKG
jgi:hypothetical protein